MDHARADLLARGGLEWIMQLARETGDGLAWPVKPSDDEVHHSLYLGTAGIVPALLEGWRHFGDQRYADAALRATRAMEGEIDEWSQYGALYLGGSGFAAVFHAAGKELGDERASAAAVRTLEGVRKAFDGERWGDFFELLYGNAGAALGALACGDLDLAVLAVEPYLRTAEATDYGVTWEVKRGEAGRPNHFAHGTIGIAYGIAAVAEAAGRQDLLDLAIAGADDVVGRNEAGSEGFQVMRGRKPAAEDSRAETYAHGWCAGGVGDILTFRLLARATGDPKWTDLVDRAWHTISTSGLPRRLRPGFWDNNGRCCGTAGVLATAGDLMVERGIGPEFAETLVADLDLRATVDGDLVSWSNHEFRDDPPDLEPTTGWSHGAAGIVRELMRWKRLATGGDHDYVVPFPDQPLARKADA